MELIAIIGVGVTLAGLILNGQRYQQEEIKTLREETQAGFKAHREETKTEFKAQREETKTEFKAQREAIISLLERMAHLEGLLEGLREAITGRRIAVAEAVADDPGQYDQS